MGEAIKGVSGRRGNISWPVPAKKTHTPQTQCTLTHTLAVTPPKTGRGGKLTKPSMGMGNQMGGGGGKRPGMNKRGRRVKGGFLHSSRNACQTCGVVEERRHVYLDVVSSVDGFPEEGHHVLSLHSGAGKPLRPLLQDALRQPHLQDNTLEMKGQ